MNLPRPCAVDPAAHPHACESAECPACGRLHFIDQSTGQLLGRRQGIGLDPFLDPLFGSLKKASFPSKRERY
jgi:hypothetical protein